MDVKALIQQKLILPGIALLKQGLTPERLTLSVVFGVGLGLIPSPVTSTILCTAIAFVLRLNQPAIQLVNQALGPGQIVFFIPFIRLGEWMFSEPPVPLSPVQMMSMVEADLIGSIGTLWHTIWHAVVAWLVVTPPFCVVLYVVLKPVVARLMVRFAPAASRTAAPTANAGPPRT